MRDGLGGEGVDEADEVGCVEFELGGFPEEPGRADGDVRTHRVGPRGNRQQFRERDGGTENKASFFGPKGEPVDAQGAEEKVFCGVGVELDNDFVEEWRHAVQVLRTACELAKWLLLRAVSVFVLFFVLFHIFSFFSRLAGGG